MNVISMMCRDSEGKGLFQYQLQAISNVLDNPLKVPLTFDVQQKSFTRPLIFIHKRIEGNINIVNVNDCLETDEMFISKNPQLRSIF